MDRFWTQFWPWIWPSAILVAVVAVILFAARWFLRGKATRRVEAPPIRRAIKALAGLLVLLAIAGWVGLSPILPDNLGDTWDTIWPWAWPTIAVIGLSYLIYVLDRWFVGGLGQRLARESEEIDEATVRRVVRSLSTGSIIGLFVLWSFLVPLSGRAADFFENTLLPWLVPTLVLIAWIALGLYIVRRGGTWLAHRAERTDNEFDDAIVGAMRRPLWLIVAVSGVRLWAEMVPLPDALVNYVDIATRASAVFLIVMFADAFIQTWMANRAEKSRVLRTTGGVLRSATKVVVYLIGILMVLSTAGVDVTPVIASLGVGSLAVGLALQKTLEDFLAGLFLAADQPVRVGDFIDLDSGEAGVVLSIGWRTTRMRTREDTFIVVPNSKLATSTLTNRSMPQSEVLFTVPVGVSYSSDLDHVAKVATEVAGGIQETHPKAIRSYKPQVVFTGFGDSSINFVAWLRASDWLGHYSMVDAFVRRLHQRFDQEGINIPFPIRTLDVPEGTTLTIEKAHGDAADL